MLMEQAKDDIQAVGAQVDFQLVVQGKVGQPQQRAAVYKIDDVDASEVLFDVKDPAARHAGCIGDQGVVDPAVRHDQYRLPVSLAKQRVEKPDSPLLHLAEALPAQVGLIPTGRRALEEPLYLLKDGSRTLASQPVLTRRDLAQVRREHDGQLFFLGDDLGGLTRAGERAGVNAVERHATKEQRDGGDLLASALGERAVPDRPFASSALVQGFPVAHEIDPASVHTCLHLPSRYFLVANGLSRSRNTSLSPRSPIFFTSFFTVTVWWAMASNSAADCSAA